VAVDLVDNKVMRLIQFLVVNLVEAQGKQDSTHNLLAAMAWCVLFGPATLAHSHRLMLAPHKDSK
jgi:hypothetical protein